MKMDPNITDGISVEANYLVCAATEIFVRYLSREVYEKHQQLTYQNLSKFVLSDEKLDFLHAVVPEKITVKKYKYVMCLKCNTNLKTTFMPSFLLILKTNPRRGRAEAEKL